MCKLLPACKDTLRKCWAPAKTNFFPCRSAVNIPGTLNNRDSHQIRAAQHALQQSKSICNIMHPLQHSKSSGNVLHTLQQSCSSGNILQVICWADRRMLIPSTEFSGLPLEYQEIKFCSFLWYLTQFLSQFITFQCNCLSFVFYLFVYLNELVQWTLTKSVQISSFRNHT